MSWSKLRALFYLLVTTMLVSALIAVLAGGLVVTMISLQSKNDEIGKKNAALAEAGINIEALTEEKATRVEEFIILQEEIKELAEELITLREEREELRAEITRKDNIIGYRDTAISLYKDRVTEALEQMNEALAPQTPDGSSPWEKLIAFGEAQTNQNYSLLYDFSDSRFREYCSREQFIEAAEQNGIGPPQTIGFLDQAVGETFAVVKYTTGLKIAVFFEMLHAENGKWVLRFNPALCK